MEYINKNEEKHLIKKDNKLNIYRISMIIILVIGILIRTVGITEMPNALNCDEASAGYEAFSIANYEIDRNGNKLPSFLVSWGSGQNALLTYLIIPFMHIFGLNTLSVRLPMAILGCISLIVIYLLLRKISNKKIALIGLAFFAICPWHIMKTRWGLESNLFPDLILIFTYLLVKGLEDNNKILYYLSFVIAGLSAYAYGTSYYFLPAFLIPLSIILIKKQKITIKQAIISIAIVGIVSMPIILYVIINTLNLQQINLPFITIPKLEVNRYKELTTMFSSDFLKSATSNLMASLRILITQYDGLKWNSIMPSGTIYLFSIVFTIIGAIDSFKKEKKVKIKYSFIFNIMFIISIILAIICEPNINRLNIIMIPVIYYTIVGICLVIIDRKKLAAGVAILYIISFGIFITCYLKEDCDKYSTFASGLEEVVQYVDKIEGKPIVIDESINYTYVLFYSKYNTKNFVDTVQYENKYVEFRKVNSFGKYHFEKISDFNDYSVFVIKKENKDKYNLEDYNVTEFDKYIVISKEVL